MKRLITCIVLILVSSLHAGDISEFKLNSDAVYHSGPGNCEESSTALGGSMLGWGIVISIGIALLAGLVHQSYAKTTTTTTTTATTR